MNKWVSVKEQRPEAYTWVLVYSDTGDVGDFPFDIGRIISGEWKCLGWDYPVTHWMPLGCVWSFSPKAQRRIPATVEKAQRMFRGRLAHNFRSYETGEPITVSSLKP